MRLSWPRDNDKRRAITRDTSRSMLRVRQATKLFFINTTWQDIERHMLQWSQVEQLPEAGPSPDLCKEPQLSVSHTDLMHHCKFENSPSWLSKPMLYHILTLVSNDSLQIRLSLAGNVRGKPFAASRRSFAHGDSGENSY